MFDAYRRLGSKVLAPVLVCAVACGSHTDNSRVHLATPVESTSVGAGDVFTMQIVGERELPTEYQIATDGTVNLPYIHRIKVAGLEPQEISDLIRKRFIEEKILADPSVIVRVKEYNSKHIFILGQVQRPGTFPFTAGLTLIQAISMAGGFNSIAKKDQLRLTRKKKDGGLQRVIVSADSIMDGRSPDILLQAGDQIYVTERIF